MPAIVAEPWDSTKTYYEGDVVSHKGYFYRRLKSSSGTNEDPKTATYTVTFSADASGNKGENVLGDTNLLPNVNKTMRVWTIADEGFSTQMERVRGLPPGALEQPYDIDYRRSYLQYNGEYSMICVRNIDSEYDEELEFMIPPANASYAGWGMPAGMNAEFVVGDYDYDTGFFGEWVYGPGAGIYEDGAPKKYDWFGGQLQGACFIPNTVLATGTGAPAFSSESFGSIFASMCSFSRDYDYATIDYSVSPPDISAGGTVTTPSFGDNWTGTPPGEIEDFYGFSGTDPDMADE